MQLEQVTENRKQQYQSFVRANGSFLQSWEWGDFQASLGLGAGQAAGQKVSRYFILGKTGEPILAAQLLERKIGSKKYLVAPYGPVLAAGTVFETEPIEFFCRELARQYQGQSKSRSGDLVFIRIEPYSLEAEDDFVAHAKSFLRKTADLNPHQTLILNLSQNREKIDAAMHPKTRYNIKLAEKKDIRIKVFEFGNSEGETAQAEAAAKQAAELFVHTSGRAGVRSFDKNYYISLLKKFGAGNSAGVHGAGSVVAKLYTAWHENDLLAANLMVYYGATAVYLFGGSSDAKRNLMAPYLLHSRAIDDAQSAGLKKYDFWGVEQDPNHPWHGFSKFKLGFGGEVVKYPGTWDFVIRPAWYNVYKIFRKANRIVRPRS